jgi:hypothetical protein
MGQAMAAKADSVGTGASVGFKTGELVLYVGPKRQSYSTHVPVLHYGHLYFYERHDTCNVVICTKTRGVRLNVREIDLLKVSEMNEFDKVMHGVTYG